MQTVSKVTSIINLITFSYSKLSFKSTIYFTTNSSYLQFYLPDLIQSRGIQLSKHCQRKIRDYQNLFLFVCIMCTISPLGFILAICVPFEPLHMLLQDLLETNISLKLSNIPYLLIFTWSGSTMATYAFQCITLCLGYTILGTSCSEFMIPTNITIKLKQASMYQVHQIQYQITTKELGTLDENTIIHLFRCCQIINKLANDVLACIEVSLMHIVLLVVYVVFGYMIIAGQHFVFGNEALVGFALVGLFTSLYVEFLVATMTDEIVTASTKFVSKSLKLSLRRSMYWKFAKSCPKCLDIKIAYPFFQMRKQTFPEFLLQGLNFLVTLIAV